MRQILLLLSCLSATFASGFSTLPVRRTIINTSTSANSLSKATRHSVALQMKQDHETAFPLFRGGASSNDATADGKCPFTAFIKLASSLYGTGGVIYVLLKAILRVVPIALEPFTEAATTLTTIQLLTYAATCLWFAYVEGYKGFQTKFSPLVVSRSFTLEMGKSKFHHFLLAPLYSMGLFHATKKRMIVSWSVTLGVFAIVRAVKLLPYPYRNIVDAGVVSGLTWGCISIILHYIKALATGKAPADPALPKP